MLVRQSVVGSQTLAGVFPPRGFLKLRHASTELLIDGADVFARNSLLAGLYSNGEIIPFSESTECKLHNQKMTITHISEP